MKDKNAAILPILAGASAQQGDDAPAGPKTLVLNKKERIKSGITHRKPKPGKNKPARGYDPVTKTWQK